MLTKLRLKRYFCEMHDLGKMIIGREPNVRILQNNVTLESERYTVEFLYPLQTMFVGRGGGVYCFHVVRPSFRPCVRPSVTFWFFL